MSEKAVNLAKNFLLVILLLLLPVLSFAAWLFSAGEQGFTSEAADYEVRASGLSAGTPIQLALTDDKKQLKLSQYSSADLTDGLSAVRALWGEVLQNPLFTPADNAQLTSALSTDSAALLRYPSALPFCLISSWFGGQSEWMIEAQTLIYCAGEGRLYLRAADGSLYAAEAKCAADTLSAAQQQFVGQRAVFAADAFSDARWPEIPLAEGEQLRLAALSTEPSDTLGEMLPPLLTAFGYSPYTRNYSDDGGQARVWVDTASRLRVQANGTVSYLTEGDPRPLRAYFETPASDKAALEAELDLANQILDNTAQAAKTGTQFTLQAALQQEGATTLVFLALYDGTPVFNEQPAAVFSFQNGALISATLHFLRYLPSEQQQYLLPARQLLAAVPPAASYPALAYRAEGELYQPAYFFQT